MNILQQAAQSAQQRLAAQGLQDPLAQMAANVGLKVNSPEAEQKLRVMGQAVAQEAAQSAQMQQASAVDKATTAYKQAFFAGKI